MSEHIPQRNDDGIGKRSFRLPILNQSYWPDVVATAQQANDLARYLARNGDRVSVVCSRSLYRRAGASLLTEDTVDGVEIRRVSRNHFNKSGLSTRALDYLQFNVACAFKAMTLPRHDVVICLTTPPFIALIGLMLRALKGTRFVYWTMDLYPDLPVEAGIIRRNGLIHRILSIFDRASLRGADRVVTLGRCMRERVLAKGVNNSKIKMIHPWSDLEEIPELAARCIELQSSGRLPDSADVDYRSVPNPYRSEWSIGDRFVVQYSGNFGIGHDAQTAFGAMLLTKDDDGMRWVIVGDGIMRPAVEEFVRTHGIRNVLIKPYQPRTRLGSLISLGDAHLILMVPGFEGVILPPQALRRPGRRAAGGVRRTGGERDRAADLGTEMRHGQRRRRGARTRAPGNPQQPGARVRARASRTASSGAALLDAPRVRGVAKADPQPRGLQIKGGSPEGLTEGCISSTYISTSPLPPCRAEHVPLRWPDASSPQATG